MSNTKDQVQNSSIKSETLLPPRFRTSANRKFLQATLDQMISEGSLQNINGFIGRRHGSGYTPSDQYVQSPDVLRSFYQLEPCIIQRDASGDVVSHIDYINYVNNLGNLCDVAVNERRSCFQDTFSFNPFIDFDKFVNYRNYFWMPSFAPVVTLPETSYASVIGKSEYFTGEFYLIDGMVVKFKTNTVRYVVEGVGRSITLTKLEDFGYHRYNADGDGLDISYFGIAPSVVNYGGVEIEYKDYITINRASRDSNAWSRTNRWIHKDAILQSGGELLEERRASRPIIEFEPDLKLFGVGVMRPVSLFDSMNTDAMGLFTDNNPVMIDGKYVSNGDTIIFSVDANPAVRNSIFTVEKVSENGGFSWRLNGQYIPDISDGVFVKRGTEYGGRAFSFDGLEWARIITKDSVNQKPLFDLVDDEDISFSDKTHYPVSDFSGTTLFSYASGATHDPVLGFGVKYKTVAGVGDIVFSYEYNTGSFKYLSPTGFVSLQTNTGYVKNLSSGEHHGMWVKCENNQGQAIVKTVTVSSPAASIELDMVEYPEELTLSELEIYVNDKFIGYDGVSIKTDDSGTYLLLPKVITKDDVVTILAYTDLNKTSGYFYTIPDNLEINPFNDGISELTMSDIFNHVESIRTNLIKSGHVNNDALLFQKGNLKAKGNKIVQHTSPMILPMFHLVDHKYNVIKAIESASILYQNFKSRLIAEVTSGDYVGSPATILDNALSVLYPYADDTTPYYHSGMIPTRPSKVETKKFLSGGAHAMLVTPGFDYLSGSSAIMVYVNDVLLRKNHEYSISGDVISLHSIQANSTVKVCYYRSTSGFSIPPTPTKLGLAPIYVPEKYRDDTYTIPVNMIRGHDGSSFVAYDDYRDDIILELETRIYNNCVVNYNSDIFDVLSYINTKMTHGDFKQIMSQSFVSWAIRNGFKDYYLHHFYDDQNPFTYNYSSFNGIDDSQLPGFWREMYRKFYGTDYPHMRPWECLNYSEKPDWWDEKYGVAPYTDGNQILWTDIAAKRPFMLDNGMLRFIPVDGVGLLKNPLDIGLVANFSILESVNSFTYGDGAPYEDAWRKSSDYLFSVIKTLCITDSATVFGVIYDRMRQVRTLDGVKYKSESGLGRLSVKNITLPSINNRTSGLISWIHDYTKVTNSGDMDSLQSIYESIDMALSHRMGGFAIKNKLSAALDVSSAAYRTVAYVPPENFHLYIDNGTPTDIVSYSGVMIERTSAGFSISGYDTANPHFIFKKPNPSGGDYDITIGGISERFVDFEPGKFIEQGTIVKYNQTFYRVLTAHSAGSFDPKYFRRLPSLPLVGGRTVTVRNRFHEDDSYLSYGENLPDIQSVCDFLQGYAKRLVDIGFVFDHSDGDIVHNWNLSMREFVFWTLSNWKTGTVLSLSPLAKEVKFISELSVVDDLFSHENGYHVRSENGQLINQSVLNIFRGSGEFSVTVDDDSVNIYAIKMVLRQKEHVMVFDRATIFGDIIYDLSRGYRKPKINLIGSKLSGWDGSMATPGALCDAGEWRNWESWKDYDCGTVVLYKNEYFQAVQNVQGSAVFVHSLWTKLKNKPKSSIMPNLDYNVKSFEYLYDYDSEVIDEERQAFAKHLIGYQPREYLRNLIPSEISQIKYFQGMIRDKGKSSAIENMFNVGSEKNITLMEEWALRSGRYGATFSNSNIDADLPASAGLNRLYALAVDGAVPGATAVTNLYKERNRSIPTTTAKTNYVRSAGYVNESDIRVRVDSMDEILDMAYGSFNIGDVIWIMDHRGSWDIKSYASIPYDIIDVKAGYIEFNRNISLNISRGDILAISYNDTNAFTRIERVEARRIYIEFSQSSIMDTWKPSKLSVFFFESCRVRPRQSYPHIAMFDRSVMPRIWKDWSSEVYSPTSVNPANGISYEFKYIRTTGATSFCGIMRDADGYGITRNNVLIHRDDFTDEILGLEASLDDIVYWTNNKVTVLTNRTNPVSVVHRFTDIKKVVLSGWGVHVLHSVGTVSKLTKSTGSSVFDVSTGINLSIPDVTTVIVDSITHVDGALIISSGGKVYKVIDTPRLVIDGSIRFGDLFAENIHHHDGYIYATIPALLGGGIVAKISMGGVIERLIESTSSISGLGRNMFTSNGRLLLTYTNGTGNQDVVFNDDTVFDSNTCRFFDEISWENYIGIVDASGDFIMDSIHTSAGCVMNYGGEERLVYLDNGFKSRSLVNPWETVDGSQYINRVNVDLIRGVFLYDNSNMELLHELDFVDIHSGKILNEAERLISFKTSFDPATYSVGGESYHVDVGTAWGQEQVGKLWWNTHATPFVVPYFQEPSYSSSVWSDTTKKATSVMEWVKSHVRPSEWDKLSGTEAGLIHGISGVTLYGDDAYSVVTTKTENGKDKSEYFFWVINPTTVSGASERHLSAHSISLMISNPKSSGIPYAQIIGINTISFVNCDKWLSSHSTSVCIDIGLSTKSNPVHNHFTMVSESDPGAILPNNIEEKWIDSLIGFDKQMNVVPDPKLPRRLRHGVENRPRQSMFVNRVQALKQWIIGVNRFLSSMPSADVIDVASLQEKASMPTPYSGNYDAVYISNDDIPVSITQVARTQAIIDVTVKGGVIIGASITNPGSGYGRLLPTTDGLFVGPMVDIISDTPDRPARLITTVNNNGELVAVHIADGGLGYKGTVRAEVRPYSILVENDMNVDGKWSIYQVGRRLIRVETQSINVSAYWEYVDWYRDGYNHLSRVYADVNSRQELSAFVSKTNKIIRVDNDSDSGWALYLMTGGGYELVGKQNACIILKDSLYDVSMSGLLYDSALYDSVAYDAGCELELRIIIETIRDQMISNGYNSVYMSLFFASLRYALTEQPSLDWAFKTSFVKVEYDAGELDEKNKHGKGSTGDISKFIEEVKPYHTKIRDILPKYSKLEDASFYVADFDIPFVQVDGETMPMPYRIEDGVIKTDYDPDTIQSSAWFNTIGNKINSLSTRVGYVSIPQAASIISASVVIEGMCRQEAKATATVNSTIVNGVQRVTVEISIDDNGDGYMYIPSASVILKYQDGLNRYDEILQCNVFMDHGLQLSFDETLFFDRVSHKEDIPDISYTDVYQIPRGSVVLSFNANLDSRTITVYDKDMNKLHVTQYRVENTELGTTVSAIQDNILLAKVEYMVSSEYLNSADRVKHFYNPSATQLGVSLEQLMSGIEYGFTTIDAGGLDESIVDIIDGGGFANQSTNFTIEGGGLVSPENMPSPEELVAFGVYESIMIVDMDSSNKIIDLTLIGGFGEEKKYQLRGETYITEVGNGYMTLDSAGVYPNGARSGSNLVLCHSADLSRIGVVAYKDKEGSKLLNPLYGHSYTPSETFESSDKIYLLTKTEEPAYLKKIDSVTVSGETEKRYSFEVPVNVTDENIMVHRGFTRLSATEYLIKPNIISPTMTRQDYTIITGSSPTTIIVETEFDNLTFRYLSMS